MYLGGMVKIRTLFLFNLRLLAFRTSREEFDSFSKAHLIFGLLLTWLVGMGRWWGEPKAQPLQQFGLGSVLYLFALTTIIRLLVPPSSARKWSYRHVLTFVSLTSLPGLLYTFPVETSFSLDVANIINTLLLIMVALWRVALLLFYLRRHAALDLVVTPVVGLLIVCLIGSTLFALNLHGATVSPLVQPRLETDRSPYDGEFDILGCLYLLSLVGNLPLILSYVAAIRRARPRKSGAGKEGRS